MLAFLSTFLMLTPSAPPISVPSAQPSQQSDLKMPVTAEEHFDLGEYYLLKGTWYSIAIRELETANKLKPDQSRYELALGCAYLGKAVALKVAAAQLEALERDKQKYALWTKQWEEAQNDPASALYGKPRPEPPVLKTRDDERPFAYSSKETAQKAFLRLKAKAEAAWKAGSLHAETDEAKTEAEYLLNWGAMIVRRYGQDFIEEKELPDRKEIAGTFRRLSKAHPAQSRYKQSLGDALTFFSTWEEIWTGKDAPKPEALEAYRSVVATNKKSTNVLYRLVSLLEKDTPEKSLEFMEQISQREPTNAFTAYRLATAVFAASPYGEFDRVMRDFIDRGTEKMVSRLKEANTTDEKEIKRIVMIHDPDKVESEDEVAHRLIQKEHLETYEPQIEKALTLMEQVPQNAELTLPVYFPDLPIWLKPVWKLGRFRDNGRLIVSWAPLTTGLEGYANIALMQNKPDRAIRAGKLRQAFGEKRMGTLSASRFPFSKLDEVRLLLGRMDVSPGYGLMIKGYKLLGDTQTAAQIREISQAFFKQFQDFEKLSHEDAASRYEIDIPVK